MHLKVKNKIAYTTEIAQTSLTEIQNLRWGGGKTTFFSKVETYSKQQPRGLVV